MTRPLLTRPAQDTLAPVRPSPSSPARTHLATQLLLASLLLALPLVPACYYSRSPSRPVPALSFQRDRAARQSCLVVFMPGFGDTPDTYREHGFAEDLINSGAACDAVAVDAHFRYYGRGEAEDAVFEDIITPAVTRGYEEIWVVGISMGGLGASLLTMKHRDLIDGVVLLAPFLGDESVHRDIRAAGGLSEWEAPRGLRRPIDATNYTAHLWSFFQGYVDDPDAMPPLFIGWGDDDHLEGPDSLLAAVQPEGHVFNAPGGHNWATWRPLWQRILQVAPIGRGSAESFE